MCSGCITCRSCPGGIWWYTTAAALVSPQDAAWFWPACLAAVSAQPCHNNGMKQQRKIRLLGNCSSVWKPSSYPSQSQMTSMKDKQMVLVCPSNYATVTSARRTLHWAAKTSAVKARHEVYVHLKTGTASEACLLVFAWIFWHASIIWHMHFVLRQVFQCKQCWARIKVEHVCLASNALNEIDSKQISLQKQRVDYLRRDLIQQGIQLQAGNINWYSIDQHQIGSCKHWWLSTGVTWVTSDLLKCCFSACWFLLFMSFLHGILF